MWSFVVLTPADGFCCVLFIYAVLCWFWCPEIGTSSVDLAQLCKLLPEDGDRTQSSKRCFLNLKNRTMDNVQKVNNCVG
jgi:hypothetical protein